MRNMRESMIPGWLRKRDEGTARPGRMLADDTVISSVNNKILTLLRQNLVPRVLANKEEIGLCSQKEHGDIILGLYLYDIRENSEIRINGMQPYDETHLQFPPVFLDLHYMLSAYSNIDLRYREEENHRVLARAMQTLHDHPVLDQETALHIELQNLSLEQKSAVWHNIGTGYQLSLFYKVTPVRLESEIRRQVSRVQEIQVDASARRKSEGSGN